MLPKDTKAIERIIWSADVDSAETLIDRIRSMPTLLYVKLDRMFVEANGFALLDRVADFGVRVFDDAKIVEIPTKIVGIAKNHLAHKPWMLNCMAGSVSTMLLEGDPDKIDGLKRFADACHVAGTLPCAVTVLTSKTPEVVEKEFGCGSVDQVLTYIEMLLDCGFTDVVCSPAEVQAIRAEERFDKLCLNTPGIRPAGKDAGDQARVDTPEAAWKAGADRFVIGRPITEGNPAENLASIVSSLELAA